MPRLPNSDIVTSFSKIRWHYMSAYDSVEMLQFSYHGLVEEHFAIDHIAF